MKKKQRVYILLSPAGIRLFSNTPELNSSLDFSNKEIKEQEVVDLNKYTLFLTPLFQKLLAEELILLMAEEFIYRKTIFSKELAEIFLERDTFLSMIPFDDDKIAHIHVTTELGVEVTAINKDLYEPFLKLAVKENKKIDYVLPISLLHRDEKLQPTYELLEKKYSHDLFKKYDFRSAKKGFVGMLKITEPQQINKLEKVYSFNLKYLLGGFIFLIVLIGLLFYSTIQAKKPGHEAFVNPVIFSK